MNTTKTRITETAVLPPVSEELIGLRAQSEQEAAALAMLVDQLHQAHKGLAALHKKLKTVEIRREGEIERAAGAVDQARLEAETLAARLGSERDQLATQLAAAGESVRALAAAAAGLPDPLAPLVEGDDASEFEARRERTAKPGEDVAAAASAVKALVELVTTRAKLQSNRVQLLRAHIDELEADAGEREQAAAELRTSLDSARAELTSTRTSLDETRRTATSLGEDLEHHKSRLSRTMTAGLEKEAQLLAEREKLEKDLASARARVEELGAKSRELTGLLRKAERCGVDLAKVLVDLVTADLEAPASDRLPALKSEHGELSELARDAANSMDDEVDGLFRQDIGEDLAAAARSAAEVVVSRRKALADALAAAESRSADLASGLKGREDELAAAGEREKQGAAARDRLEAQLGAAREDLEARAKELAERGRETTGLRADLAKAAAQITDLQARLVEAKAVQADLVRTQGELVTTRKDLDGAKARLDQMAQLTAQLGRQLVELAGAADGNLAVAGLKAEGSISRLTRTVSRLENDTGRTDPVATAKTSLEVADKLIGRLTQLGAELTRRGEVLDQQKRERAELETRLAEGQKQLAAKDAEVRRLSESLTDAEQAAKRGGQAAERLSAREQELATAQAELARLKELSRQTAAELEELRARSEDTAVGLTREVAELRRRLGEEQKARRTAEANANERLEQAETQAGTLRAKTLQLEQTVEEREERLTTLAAEADAAAELRAHLAETQAKADAAGKELHAAQDRIRKLEAEADSRPGDAAASTEVAAAHRERDAALAKLRSLERKLADESGSAASFKALNESLKRKQEERAAAHRGELEALQERFDTAADENRRLKEKLAGLQAKVKTLTNL